MSFQITALPEDFHEDPYPHYAALREDPVCRQPDGSLVLSHWADLDRVYRDTTRFISDKKAVFGPKYGVGTPLYEHHTTSLVFNDPPLHTRVRKVMTGALTPRALQRMEPGLIALVEQLLDDMEGRAEAELVMDFAGAIPIEVIGNLLDIPRDDRGPLRDWSLAILGALEPVLTPEEEAEGNQAVTDFMAFLRHIIEDRRRNPGDPETDVLTRLMREEGGEGLSETELYQNCIFILNAGHETTTNLIGNALELLDRDRETRARLIAEPGLMPGAVDEFLRLESPNQFGNRLTAEKVELHGVTIPAGTDLHLCIGAANRDPARFEAPDSLQPERKPNRHLAFAGGPHTCVGLTLARMEGRIAVERFLARFPDYEIAPGARRGRRVRFRGFAHLPARLS
ncbi:cytochrome P450 [Aquicoccus sp. SCR17]|nr:cytochrome P450 [Carideicomes alvinocaridis]